VNIGGVDERQPDVLADEAGLRSIDRAATRSRETRYGQETSHRRRYYRSRLLSSSRFARHTRGT
jgi:hypothetical protein